MAFGGTSYARCGLGHQVFDNENYLVSNHRIWLCQYGPIKWPAISVKLISKRAIDEHQWAGNTSSNLFDKLMLMCAQKNSISRLGEQSGLGTFWPGHLAETGNSRPLNCLRKTGNVEVDATGETWELSLRTWDSLTSTRFGPLVDNVLSHSNLNLT